MSGDEQQVIHIRAAAKRNGITSLVIGVAKIVLAILALTLFPKYLFLASIFLMSAGFVAVLVGWFKLREPEHSLALTPESIRFNHKRGFWQLRWDNIQRMACPRVRHGMEHIELDYIGFRLKQYAPFVHNVSPRLATHLLMEQRALLLQEDSDCATGSCYNQDFLDDDKYHLEDGEVVTGVKAMLANRMARLRNILGYDIFIAASELDRSPSEFVALLQQCQVAAVQSDNRP